MRHVVMLQMISLVKIFRRLSSKFFHVQQFVLKLYFGESKTYFKLIVHTYIYFYSLMCRGYMHISNKLKSHCCYAFYYKTMLL